VELGTMPVFWEVLASILLLASERSKGPNNDVDCFGAWSFADKVEEEENDSERPGSCCCRNREAKVPPLFDRLAYRSLLLL